MGITIRRSVISLLTVLLVTARILFAFSLPTTVFAAAGDECLPNYVTEQDGSWLTNARGDCVQVNDAVWLSQSGCTDASGNGTGDWSGISCAKIKTAYTAFQDHNGGPVGDVSETGANPTSLYDNACGKVGWLDAVNLGKKLRIFGCSFVMGVTQFVNALLLTGTMLLATQADSIPTCPPGGEVNGKKCPPLQFIGKAAVTDADMLFVINSAAGDLTEPIETVLINPSTNSFGYVVRSAYNRVLGFVDIFLIVILLITALANILQFRLNVFALKKILPSLIVGFIAAQGSFFIVRAGLEFSGQIAKGVSSLGAKTYSMQGFANAFSSFPFSQQEIANAGVPGVECDYVASKAFMTEKCEPNSDPSQGKLSRQIMSTLFTLVPAIMLIILGFLLLIRRFVFFFLVPLAPLAFISLGFPPMASIWSRWSKTLQGWLLMPVIASFWIWLALIWFDSHLVNGGTVNPVENGIVPALVNYAFGFGGLLAAIRTPFSYAGDAKFALEKLASFGRAAALEYTPAGAVMRASNRFSAMSKEKQNQLMQGDVVKNRIARRFGGNTINRAVNRKELSQEKDSAFQKSEASQQKAVAELQLSDGMLRTASRRFTNPENRYWLNPFGIVERRAQGLGKAMEKTASLFDRFGNMTARAGFETYAQRESKMKQLEEDTKKISASSSSAIEARRLQDEGLQRRARFYRDQASEMAERAGTAFLNSEQKYIRGDIAPEQKKFLELMDKAKDGKLNRSQSSELRLLIDRVAPVNERKALRNYVDSYQASLAAGVPPPALTPSNYKAYTRAKDAKARADETALQRKRVIGNTEAAKLGVEKENKDAMYEYNTKATIERARRNNLINIVNDNELMLGTADGDVLRHEFAHYASKMDAKHPLREVMLNAGILDNDGKVIDTSIARYTPANVAKMSAAIGEIEVKGTKNSLLRQVVANRARSGYGNETDGKLKVRKGGQGAEELNKAAGDVKAVETYARGLGGHYGAVDGDYNKVVLNFGGVYRAIREEEDLATNLPAMSKLLDALETNAATSTDPTVKKVAAQLATKDYSYKIPKESALYATYLSSGVTMDSDGTIHNRTLVEFLNDFNELHNVEGKLSSQEVSGYLKTFRSSKTFLKQVQANLINSSPGDAVMPE